MFVFVTRRKFDVYVSLLYSTYRNTYSLTFVESISIRFHLAKFKNPPQVHILNKYIPVYERVFILIKYLYLLFILIYTY